jgi:hypothetical protein
MMQKAFLLILTVCLNSPAQAFDFTPLALPYSIDDAIQVRVCPAYPHAGKRHPLQYRNLIGSGKRRADQIFGLLHDQEGNLNNMFWTYNLKKAGSRGYSQLPWEPR